ncbi:HAMP domain-containing histidine kinase [Paenibacillus doosanensis]|uniref:sensor histidine kinase n=1 Tax=Paenibacillus doosanensis TaxID=1229154 RepID=UPI00217F4699|nr:HAMP domain-containing sensor histidine kinase [Paenibacillus doosanensis]MCS7458977.1 HAMP domain-containing histidine kinase [Paenibacillus doosanensis]
MDEEPLLKKIRNSKPQIVQFWLRGAIKLSGLAGIEKLQRNGDRYFDYLLDIHIPAAAHPFQAVVPDWCARYSELKLQIIDIIDCSHRWRQAFFAYCGDWAPKDLLQAISMRIDYFEVRLCEGYWQRTVSSLKEKDMAIHQLHDDRINLLGKMAASMAHEIRNPLTSIKGFLKLLRSNIQSLPREKADAYLEFIEEECNNMHMQVTGFLSFSRRPIIEEEMAHIPVKQMIEYNLSLLNPRLINENVHLSISIADHLTLNCQRLAIQQVLNNLINNGIDALSEIKHEKKMEIHAFEESRGISIHISNNGPAIPAEISNTLFTPFVTNKTNGTGLGLAICKQIMSKNEGDITFQSSEEKTVFILTFPNRPACDMQPVRN